MNDHDNELLLKANAFDRTAITEIYNAYHQPLYRYIYRQIGTVETSRDITSDKWRNYRRQPYL